MKRSLLVNILIIMLVTLVVLVALVMVIIAIVADNVPSPGFTRPGTDNNTAIQPRIPAHCRINCGKCPAVTYAMTKQTVRGGNGCLNGIVKAVHQERIKL